MIRALKHRCVGAMLRIFILAILILNIHAEQALSESYIFRWKDYKIKPEGFCKIITGDLDNDGKDECILRAFSHLYLFKWDGFRLKPLWERADAEADIGDLTGRGKLQLLIMNFEEDSSPGGRYLIYVYTFDGKTCVLGEKLSLPCLSAPEMKHNYIMAVGPLEKGQRSCLALIVSTPDEMGNRFNKFSVLKWEGKEFKIIKEANKKSIKTRWIGEARGLVAASLSQGKEPTFLYLDRFMGGVDTSIIQVKQKSNKLILEPITGLFGIGQPTISLVNYKNKGWILIGEGSQSPRYPQRFIYGFRLQAGKIDKYIKYPMKDIMGLSVGDIYGNGKKSILVVDSKGIYSLPLSRVLDLPSEPVEKLWPGFSQSAGSHSN